MLNFYVQSQGVANEIIAWRLVVDVINILSCSHYSINISFNVEGMPLTSLPTYEPN
jgi:hypothetical protein